MRDRNVVLDRLSSSLYARRSSYCSIRPHSPVVRLKQNRSYPSSSPRVTFSCAHSPFFVRRTVSNGCAPSHARYFFQTETPFCPPECAPFFIRAPPAESAHLAFPVNPLCAFLHLPNSIFTLFCFFQSIPTYPFIYNSSYICRFTTFFPNTTALSDKFPPKKHKKDTEQYRSVSSCINSVLS